MEKSDAEAIRWAKLAANQGHVLAQYNLGIIYSNGNGVAPDDTEAARWYELAAQQGYVLAQSSLGLQYSAGRGVSRDPVRALMWLNLAAARGDKRAATVRDEITLTMTPVEIAEARKLSGAWKPKAQPTP